MRGWRLDEIKLEKVVSEKEPTELEASLSSKRIKNKIEQTKRVNLASSVKSSKQNINSIQL